MCWTYFKTIGHSLKIWAPLRKLFATPGVSSWLRAWSRPMLKTTVPGQRLAKKTQASSDTEIQELNSY